MPFSQKTLDFLFENRLHDSRIWFEEHKSDYRQYILEPLRELVRSLSPFMLEIDDQFTIDPRVDKTICRIWRDTRYSHDKSLYRDTMWIIFRRGEKMHTSEFPSLYFEITCTGFNYGTGFYHASTGYMETLRSLILAGSPAFQRAQDSFSRQSIFHMEGECYKRPHFPDQPDSLRQWLERRNISFCSENIADFPLLFSDQLVPYLVKGFQSIAPVYDFLLQTSYQEKLKSM